MTRSLRRRAARTVLFAVAVAARTAAGADGGTSDALAAFEAAESNARAIVVGPGIPARAEPPSPPPGPAAAERVRVRLRAIDLARRAAGAVGLSAGPAEVGLAARAFAGLLGDTARAIASVEPPAGLDAATEAAYWEQVHERVAALRAEARAMYRSCAERGDAATARGCARELGGATSGEGGVSAGPERGRAGSGPAGMSPESERIAHYVRARSGDLAACLAGPPPAAAGAKLALIARIDVADGRPRAVEIADDGGAAGRLTACVAAHLSLWRLPLAGEATIEVPVEVEWAP